MTDTLSPPAGLRRPLRRTARWTAFVGGSLFWLGTLLHPARDGWSIAAVGERYGLTHDVQAAGLGLQIVCLASMIALGHQVSRRRDLRAWYAALTGTLLWFALIIFDGSHNPVRAQYEPSLVHQPADLDTPAALIVIPALLIFPLSYAWLGWTLRGLTGALLAVGAVTYTLGGLFIFTNGPRFGLIQLLEVTGATLYAAAYVLLGRRT